MTKSNKNILRALAGETLKTPPIWVMRQAGRYLPEYRKLRAKAGDFLSLCYNSELAAEVTLQPIERFKLDAAIIFADILLIPQALGSELSFLEGDGPRLSRISNKNDILKLKPVNSIHEHLEPIYNTVSLVAEQLPPKVALIGFAGAPWTVATYMIAGKGTKDQGPAHKFLKEDKDSFEMLINLLTEATILYLSKQIDAGAEVIKIFDSWAGSLKGEDFVNYAIIPIKKIITALNKLHPDVPIIAFPRGAELKYINFAIETGANCVAIDHSIDPEWAAKNLQIDSCIQGNLNPKHMVTGGKALLEETTKILDCFSNGPHIFNLGHGITPDGKPENLQLMIDKIRSN
ncbi:uroporphyrinogen decarboxylase [bacterium]|nr:uroporphyrinogen decarboxylase [Paracoccaceae bacterium]MDC0468765.1 uroporphyrinogen decarboxylase [bacterium]